MQGFDSPTAPLFFQGKKEKEKRKKERRGIEPLDLSCNVLFWLNKNSAMSSLHGHFCDRPVRTKFLREGAKSNVKKQSRVKRIFFRSSFQFFNF